MNLTIVRRVATAAVIAGLTYWITTHTYWAEETVPQRPRGEARSDPFYAAERLVRTLGGHAVYDRLWALPAGNTIVVTAYYQWDRSSTHRALLEHWVESGGRLVTDMGGFLGPSAAFSRWTGISSRTIKHDPKHLIKQTLGGCRDEEESGVSLWPATNSPRRYQLCGVFVTSFLTSTHSPVWSLADTDGIQAMRINIGRGSVTVVNGDPFTYTQLLKGADAALLVAASQLHPGDDVHFFSDQEHLSLLALTWQFGFPVVVLLLGALVFILWRAAPRLGPIIASPDRARRSLAEQIRGTGQFLMRVGDGEALHAATVRGLLSVATLRISGFSSLPSTERIQRLAATTGFAADALAAALNPNTIRRANELRSAIALLEAARREILRKDNRSTDGN